MSTVARDTIPETRALGIGTRAVHAAQEQPDPATNARAVPIYATTSYVFDNAGTCGRSLRAAKVRQHLHAHHESHHRRLRTPRGVSRGRRRGGGDRQRPGGADARHSQPRPGRRLDHRLEGAVRRYGGALRPHAAAARHHHAVRRHPRSRRGARRHRRHHARPVRGDARQPEARRSRFPHPRGHRTRRGNSARRRQHVRHADPLPPHRARRRHRAALSHEMDRRARHVHRRHRGGRRRFRLGETHRDSRRCSRTPTRRITD